MALAKIATGIVATKYVVGYNAGSPAMNRRSVLQSALYGGAFSVLAASLFGASAQAQRAQPVEVTVAVAANFAEPAKVLAVLFETATGHKLSLSFGATGQFYAQIVQGAPFEILLSADRATPSKAIADGYAVSGTAFTYATGRLVLYSKTPGLVQGLATLSNAKFAKIAIANPDIAPYGAAGLMVMKALDAYPTLEPRIVMGNTIAQTYHFVETGNAEFGFVALSQVIFVSGGSRWLVPGDLHNPIMQDAVLLQPGAKSTAARAFLAFLKGAEARAVIEKFGYEFGG